ncbi:hypothetical protein AAEU29_13030 [Pseudoalteromonas sp. SSM20]|uniref:hypothetical protein n=1 Tax=Pseudoalteromonas sp. SSM20 TaxID=3139394 RepID=UPI003BA96A13
MAQLSILFNTEELSADTWYNANIEDFRQSICVTRHTTSTLDIFIWGDIAYRHLDRQITSEILNNRFESYCGRSWIAINNKSRIINFATDTYGAFPILYYKNNNDIVLASSRTALNQSLKKPLELNKHSLKEIVVLGQLFSSNSILKNTTHFMGNTQATLTIKNSDFTQKSNKNEIFNSNLKTKYSDAKEALIEAVRMSVNSGINPLISLSGGLDSRAILAACDLLNLKPDALCYGVANSTDVNYAKLLANSCGLILHHPTNLKTNITDSVIHRVSKASMGEVPFHHAHALIDDKILNKTLGRSIITGTGAESYRAFYYDRGMPGFNFFDLSLLNNWSTPRIKRYIQEEFLKQTHPLLAPLLGHKSIEEKIEPVFERYINPLLPATKQADIFYLTTRCQRMVVAGQQLLDSYYNRSHPFLNHDVVKTMLHLPAKLKLHSTFHRQFIADVSPKLANLPWDKTQKPLKKGLNFSEKYPGLATKIKLNAAYGKASKPMYLYGYHHLNANVLDDTLRLITDNDSEFCTLKHLVQKHKLENYLIGFGLIWLNMNNPIKLQKAG